MLKRLCSWMKERIVAGERGRERFRLGPQRAPQES